MKSILGGSLTNLLEVDTIKTEYAPIERVVTINSTAATTLTADQILRGNILRTNFSTSITDVMPSAASLVAALPQCEVGDVFQTNIIISPNTVGIAWSFTVGAGGTNRANISGSNLSNTASNLLYGFNFVITNVSTPAYNLFRYSWISNNA